MRGKGNRERIAYIDDGAAEAMEIWIAARGEELGSLFCPITQRGEVIIRPITDQSRLFDLADSGHQGESASVLTPRSSPIVCVGSPGPRGGRLRRPAVRRSCQCDHHRSLRPSG